MNHIECVKPGTDNFVFISYAHLDKDQVYPDIHKISETNLIWFDKGIPPGEDWADEISKAIDHCSQFLVFLSPQALVSDNVNNEISYALDKGKRVLRVDLNPLQLNGGMRLRLHRY